MIVRLVVRFLLMTLLAGLLKGDSGCTLVSVSLGQGVKALL